MNVFEFIEKQKPHLSVQELLLFDIAKSLHRSIELQKEGLAWSKSVAGLLREEPEDGTPLS